MNKIVSSNVAPSESFQPNEESKGESTEASQLDPSHSEEAALEKARREWTDMFLKNGGFNYILTLFKTKTASTEMNDTFQLKKLSFLITLLRVFLTAAFGTEPEKEIEEAVLLVRKSSSVGNE